MSVWIMLSKNVDEIAQTDQSVGCGFIGHCDHVNYKYQHGPYIYHRDHLGTYYTSLHVRVQSVYVSARMRVRYLTQTNLEVCTIVRKIQDVIQLTIYYRRIFGAGNQHPTISVNIPEYNASRSQDSLLNN